MRLLTSIIIGLGLLALWGCSEDALEPTLSDEDAIEQIIEAIEESDEENYFYSNLDDENENALFKPLGDYLLKPIYPIRFGRIGSRPIIRNIFIDFPTENTATVTFEKVLQGYFVILSAYTPEENPVEIYRVNKPMVHEFQRIAHFEKIGDENDRPRDRWKLVDFSMAVGRSIEDNESSVAEEALDITYLKIEYDGNVIEIENPLEYLQNRENLFTFERGTEVKLTVHVKNELPSDEKVMAPNSDATELVRLHFARHRFRRLHGIRRFDFNGTVGENLNEYVGTWTVGDWVRIHHAAIDVINNGTILDDDVDRYPYRSVTWSTPYRVLHPQD
jgi:hypothetical protein